VEAEAVAVEPLPGADVGRPQKAAVEAVAPGVVGALDDRRRRAARLQAEAGAAVAADVQKGADGAVPAADDEDVLAAEVDGQEVAGVGDGVGATDVGPHLPEEGFLLPFVDGGVVEPADPAGWSRRPSAAPVRRSMLF
jgi:hypothetical protein